MKTWLKFALVGAGIGVLCLVIALISDSFIVCNGITITSDGSCHSLITQVFGDVFYYISFPLKSFNLSLLGTIALGVVFLFIYGAIIGLIVEKIREK